VDKGEAPRCDNCKKDLHDVAATLVALKCNHEFHAACIAQRARSHGTCPMCKEPVVHWNNLGMLEQLEFVFGGLVIAIFVTRQFAFTGCSRTGTDRTVE
jgi:hypothetical protein